jgi:hypothetical protein
MVDQKAYNYLKRYSGKYDMESLKQKLINSGYSKKVVDEAANALGSSASKPMPSQKPQPVKMVGKQAVANQMQKGQGVQPQMQGQKPKKAWLWILIIFILLVAAGVAVYYFLFMRE